MGEIIEAYEQKVHSLYHIVGAQVELEFREAVRDKMGMILEAVMAEVERRKSAAANGQPQAMDDQMEKADDGH